MAVAALDASSLPRVNVESSLFIPNLSSARFMQSSKSEMLSLGCHPWGMTAIPISAKLHILCIHTTAWTYCRCCPRIACSSIHGKLRGGNECWKGGNTHLEGGDERLEGGDKHLEGGDKRLEGGNECLKGGKEHLEGCDEHFGGSGQ